MSIRSLGESMPKATPPTQTLDVKNVAPTTSSHEPSSFSRVLDGLGKEINAGERVMRGAIAAGSGGDIGAGQLLALQAGVYRYGEVVDLASKLIDRTSSGIKTVINGSGQ